MMFLEWLHAHNAPEPLQPLQEHIAPVVDDLKVADLDLDLMYSQIDERQTLASATGVRQREANAEIHTDLPITMFMVGDIHHGSIFTNEKMWRAHAEQIIATPGAYIGFLHNLIDNAGPTVFSENMLNNTIAPEIQFESMKQQVQELNDADKILVAITGKCHEGWLYKTAGIDADKLLYDVVDRHFPILQNGGILHLKVGEETYHIGLYHEQGPFNSNFNPEHSLRQNRRLSDRRTDVEVGAHHHVSSVTMDWEGSPQHGQTVVYIRAGTYKGVWPEGGGIDDMFVVDRRGKTGEPPGNSVTLYPHEHRAVANMGFENSVDGNNQSRLAELMKREGFWNNILEMIECE